MWLTVTQAVKAKAIYQQRKGSNNYDLKSNLFKVRGVLEVESEYAWWIKQQLMKQDTNIFKYLASKEYEFLIITWIAGDHLAISATLAALECAFSISGNIVTKKRNRLGASNTRRLLCLQD
jgi:hypothetical protein